MAKRYMKDNNLLPKDLNKHEKAQKMKKVYQPQIVNLIDQEDGMQSIYPIQNRQKNQQYLHTEQHDTELCHRKNELHHQQTVCLVCCRQNFGSGKYILSCSHILCNECLLYWQQISDLCPICNKKATSILNILDGQQRTTKLKFNSFMPQCSKCNNNNHYHLMYLCDQCNKSCIHTYCQPSLIKQSKAEKWVCQHCIYNNYYQNKYNSESISQDAQEYYAGGEDDGFVVPDHVVQYMPDFYQDFYDSKPTKKQNPKAKDNKSKAQPRKKRQR